MSQQLVSKNDESSIVDEEEGEITENEILSENEMINARLEERLKAVRQGNARKQKNDSSSVQYYGVVNENNYDATVEGNVLFLVDEDIEMDVDNEVKPDVIFNERIVPVILNESKAVFPVEKVPEKSVVPNQRPQPQPSTRLPRLPRLPRPNEPRRDRMDEDPPVSLVLTFSDDESDMEDFEGGKEVTMESFESETVQLDEFGENQRKDGAYYGTSSRSSVSVPPSPTPNELPMESSSPTASSTTMMSVTEEGEGEGDGANAQSSSSNVSTKRRRKRTRSKRNPVLKLQSIEQDIEELRRKIKERESQAIKRNSNNSIKTVDIEDSSSSSSSAAAVENERDTKKLKILEKELLFPFVKKEPVNDEIRSQESSSLKQLTSVISSLPSLRLVDDPSGGSGVSPPTPTRDPPSFSKESIIATSLDGLLRSLEADLSSLQSRIEETRKLRASLAVNSSSSPTSSVFSLSGSNEISRFDADPCSLFVPPGFVWTLFLFSGCPLSFAPVGSSWGERILMNLVALCMRSGAKSGRIVSNSNSIAVCGSNQEERSRHGTGRRIGILDGNEDEDDESGILLSTPIRLPYFSPLLSLRSYRLSPSFLLVGGRTFGGLSSLTFTPFIDPIAPMCTHDVSGVCHDGFCPFQHVGRRWSDESELIRSLYDHAHSDSSGGVGGSGGDVGSISLSSVLIRINFISNSSSSSPTSTSTSKSAKQFKESITVVPSSSSIRSVQMPLPSSRSPLKSSYVSTIINRLNSTGETSPNARLSLAAFQIHNHFPSRDIINSRWSLRSGNAADRSSWIERGGSASKDEEEEFESKWSRSSHELQLVNNSIAQPSRYFDSILNGFAGQSEKFVFVPPVMRNVAQSRACFAIHILLNSSNSPPPLQERLASCLHQDPRWESGWILSAASMSSRNESYDIFVAGTQAIPWSSLLWRLRIEFATSISVAIRDSWTYLSMMCETSLQSPLVCVPTSFTSFETEKENEVGAVLNSSPRLAILSLLIFLIDTIGVENPGLLHSSLLTSAKRIKWLRLFPSPLQRARLLMGIMSCDGGGGTKSFSIPRVGEWSGLLQSPPGVSGVRFPEFLGLSSGHGDSLRSLSGYLCPEVLYGLWGIVNGELWSYSEFSEDNEDVVSESAMKWGRDICSILESGFVESEDFHRTIENDYTQEFPLLNAAESLVALVLGNCPPLVRRELALLFQSRLGTWVHIPGLLLLLMDDSDSENVDLCDADRIVNGISRSSPSQILFSVAILATLAPTRARELFFSGNVAEMVINAIARTVHVGEYFFSENEKTEPWRLLRVCCVCLGIHQPWFDEKDVGGPMGRGRGRDFDRFEGFVNHLCIARFRDPKIDTVLRIFVMVGVMTMIGCEYYDYEANDDQCLMIMKEVISQLREESRFGKSGACSDSLAVLSFVPPLWGFRTSRKNSETNSKWMSVLWGEGLKSIRDVELHAWGFGAAAAQYSCPLFGGSAGMANLIAMLDGDRIERRLDRLIYGHPYFSTLLVTYLMSLDCSVRGFDLSGGKNVGGGEKFGIASSFFVRKLLCSRLPDATRHFLAALPCARLNPWIVQASLVASFFFRRIESIAAVGDDGDDGDGDEMDENRSTFFVKGGYLSSIEKQWVSECIQSPKSSQCWPVRALSLSLCKLVLFYISKLQNLPKNPCQGLLTQLREGQFAMNADFWEFALNFCTVIFDDDSSVLPAWEKMRDERGVRRLVRKIAPESDGSSQDKSG